MTWPIQDHADAILNLLRADAELVVCDGEVPKDVSPPYVLVYFAMNTPSASADPGKVKLSTCSDVADMRAYCHSVGSAPEAPRAARAVAGRVRAALLNVTPVIEGRVVWPIEWDDGQLPHRDDDVPARPVFDQVDVYRLVSVPRIP